MNTRNSVKQRREQKIKALQRRSLEASFDDEFELNTNSAPLYSQDRRSDAVEFDDIDPEKAWKANPNPWSSWDENEREWKGSFVKRALPDKSKLPERRKPSFFTDLQWKLVISLLIFAVIWAMFRYDNAWTRTGQAYVKQAITDEIDFEAAAVWYKEMFSGAPSFIPIFEQDPKEAIGADGRIRLPVVSPLDNGVLVRTFAELLNGVELAGEPGQNVFAAEEGRVILAESNETSSSIVIQHANKRVTIYGKLGEVSVEANDWVEAGDPIGRLSEMSTAEPNRLFFAVKQDGAYVDPLDVIPID